jgi:hypothetical protein
MRSGVLKTGFERHYGPALRAGCSMAAQSRFAAKSKLEFFTAA